MDSNTLWHELYSPDEMTFKFRTKIEANAFMLGIAHASTSMTIITHDRIEGQWRVIVKNCENSG